LQGTQERVQLFRRAGKKALCPPSSWSLWSLLPWEQQPSSARRQVSWRQWPASRGLWPLQQGRVVIILEVEEGQGRGDHEIIIANNCSVEGMATQIAASGDFTTIIYARMHLVLLNDVLLEEQGPSEVVCHLRRKEGIRSTKKEVSK
jgi:hypothetical protein